MHSHNTLCVLTSLIMLTTVSLPFSIPLPLSSSSFHVLASILFLHALSPPIDLPSSLPPSLPLRSMLQIFYWYRMQMAPRLLARHGQGGGLSVVVS